MVNEYEAILGIFLIMGLIYFFIWRRSKIIGGIALIMSNLALLVPYGGTDYEMIAWIAVMCSMTATVVEFGYAKMGHTRS